jgi:hypothetical protein
MLKLLQPPRQSPFDVIVEGDSFNLIRALKDVNPNPSRLGHLIDFVRIESSVFRSVEFSFTPRMGNSVAHCLARFSKGLPSSFVWLKDPPNFICNAGLCGGFFGLIYELHFLITTTKNKQTNKKKR